MHDALARVRAEAAEIVRIGAAANLPFSEIASLIEQGTRPDKVLQAIERAQQPAAAPRPAPTESLFQRPGSGKPKSPPLFDPGQIRSRFDRTL